MIEDTTPTKIACKEHDILGGTQLPDYEQGVADERKRLRCNELRIRVAAALAEYNIGWTAPFGDMVKRNQEMYLEEADCALAVIFGKEQGN